ncbi:MAG: pyridoxamine 5'-phosphate oxidase family protein [Planctomycetota bacterium]|jgi:predicted pyridoxine 5'-phosphate oxidase superfamily flavin-nucleotide-binding protein
MARNYLEVVFTDSVKRTQEHYGTRAAAARMEELDERGGVLSDKEKEFLAERDGFYMATVGENDWPYVQFRGGEPGFLRVLDDRTLNYTDLLGNRQFISMGNLTTNDRVSLFFMDYAQRMRLKVLARARVVDGEDSREVYFDVVAYDWNCPQHITPRFTAAEWAETHAAETGS